MPNAYQQRKFREAKINALFGLLYALDEGDIPDKTGYSWTTGQIAERFDDMFLPVHPRSLLAVLREADIPHDSRNRFLTWVIHSNRDELAKLHREYIGASKITRVISGEVESQDDDQENVDGPSETTGQE